MVIITNSPHTGFTLLCIVAYFRRVFSIYLPPFHILTLWMKKDTVGPISTLLFVAAYLSLIKRDDSMIIRADSRSWSTMSLTIFKISAWSLLNSMPLLSSSLFFIFSYFFMFQLTVFSECRIINNANEAKRTRRVSCMCLHSMLIKYDFIL